jgi:tRNA (guanine-N7-)-methyltransferase
VTRDAPPAVSRAERDPVAARSGTRFWAEVFGREAPVEVEIGSGDGTFLLAAAARRPDVDFFGLERSPSKARRLAARVARQSLPNIRSLCADATCVIELIPSASVTAYHIYFPDPWPKNRHARRRLVTPVLIAALARTLVQGGQLLVATDVYGYLRLMRAHVLADPAFEERAMADDHPGFGTAFARKYRAAGRAVYAATFERRSA